METKNMYNDLSKKNRIDVLPWIEKYRPASLDEIISHKTVINVLKTTIANNKLQHILFHGVSGVGKCLAPGTPIIMYDGSITNVENLKIGDQLMGDDNTPRQILSTISGEDNMYNIIQQFGDNYIVNSEHIICLKLWCPYQIYTELGYSDIGMNNSNKKTYNLIWFEKHVLNHQSFSYLPDLYRYKQFLIENNIANREGDICDISIKDYIAKQTKWKYAYKGFKCDKITCWSKKKVNLDPYLLGYWLAKSNDLISFDVEPFDVESFDVESFDVAYDVASGIASLDMTFINNLKKNLLNNKHVPNDYKYNDVNIRSRLLKGFLNGNSNISKSRLLYDDIVFIARSLGLIADVVILNNINSNLKYYTININSNVHSRLYNIHVVKLSRGSYYGFEIDGNKRFLLGDFTVTHNTSTIMACAKELYGDKIDLMTLNINASEERGIEVVRNRIQQFVDAKIIHSETNKSIFKLVILDEADAMTSDAQAMLRKVIENYSYCARFCLICNYIKKITPALQSRCACYRFPPLKPQDIEKKIIAVAKLENVKITKSGIETIIKRSKGDMRRVLNILQSTSMSYDLITGAVINKCIGYPNSKDIDKIMNSLVYDNFETSCKLISDIKTKHGYSLQDIITEITSELISIIENQNNSKFKKLDQFYILSIIKTLSVIEYNLTTCVTDSLQLSALVGAFKLAS